MYLSRRSHRAAFCLTAAIFMAFPALAQTTKTAPAQSQAQPPSDGSGTTTVTILAKRRPPVSVRSFSTISSGTSDSCSFMTGNAEAEDLTDSYLSDMGYDTGNMTQQAPAQVIDPNTGNPDTTGDTRPRVNDRAIYGDASQTTGNLGQTNPGDMSGGASGYGMTAATPGGCTQAEGAFAGGRNFIARKDTSLKDAYAAYDAKDYAKALVLFEKTYNKISGHDDAALMLAQMYLNGEGTARDVTKAVYWLKKVAELPVSDPRNRAPFDPEHPYEMTEYRTQGCMALARLYMTGTGVAKDPKEAKKWFMAAADGGYVPAMHDVGLMLQSGYGGEKNVPKAMTYFERAGKTGFAPSLYTLGEIYYTGADGVPQDKTKAGAWLLAAAKAGHPDALYAVGRMYDLGEGGATANLQTALIYYKEAAVKGQVDAQTTLATYLYTGEGGAPKDVDTARKLFQAAAQQGEPEAMFNLAVMLFNGEGGPKDRAMAFVWFKLAAASGLDKAQAAVTELGPKLTADERAQADAILNPKPKA
ncbi:MAG TPA: SEL1-like repeat protein [Asticcacaulis sp.]|nr:SEL1-like repeat protein [Asticcacaulis sp.]